MRIDLRCIMFRGITGGALAEQQHHRAAAAGAYVALHNLRALQAEGAAGQLAQVRGNRFLSGGSRGNG